MTTSNAITIATTVNAPLEKVWQYWTEPVHICNWNFASDEWHSPKAENDLKVGGKFNYRMEAKDGNMGFDFEGKYDRLKDKEMISYVMADGRKVEITFEEKGNITQVTETFDPEDSFPKEVQQQGWQNILDNFKKYVEGNK